MANKKILTRDEFAAITKNAAKEMASDQELADDALDLLLRADTHKWIHQTTWLGEPILNLPQDMFAMQEIIFRSRPKFIVEIGVAWGGALLFYSTLMEICGGEGIIGVDVFIPEDLKKRLASHGKISERLTLIEGSSIDEETVEKVKAITKDCKDVLVILDSNHTHDHVLKELQMYSPFVGERQYLVCGDTIIEDMPEQKHGTRNWGPGNNPKTALIEFMNENKEFEIDAEIENKLLFTCNPSGYLRRLSK